MKVSKIMAQRARIKLASTDIDKINKVCADIKDISDKTGVKLHGPVPLPTEKTKYTVNKSTFVHKNAREQFEMRIHKRLIDISSPTPKTIDALSNLNLPAGVDVEIKM